MTESQQPTPSVPEVARRVFAVERLELVERYAELYRTPYGPKTERDALSAQVHRMIDRTPRRRDALAPRFRRAQPQKQQKAEQLSMW